MGAPGNPATKLGNVRPESVKLVRTSELRTLPVGAEVVLTENADLTLPKSADPPPEKAEPVPENTEVDAADLVPESTDPIPETTDPAPEIADPEKADLEPEDDELAIP